jgi:hypothetical protein
METHPLLAAQRSVPAQGAAKPSPQNSRSAALLADTLVLAPNAFGGPHGTMFYVHDGSSHVSLLLVLPHLVGHARGLRSRLQPERHARALARAIWKGLAP